MNDSIPKADSVVTNTVVAIPLAGPLAGSERIGAKADSRRRAPFFAGPENRLTQVALDEVLGRQSTMHSPLVLHGPAAAGKSHLVVGLAQWWRQHRKGESVVLLGGRQFVEQVAAATDIHDQLSWREQCRGASLFVLDDLAPLAGRRAAQHELCRILDCLDLSGGLAIVTSRTPPGNIAGLAPSLVSRLSAGLAAPLALPGAAARRAIVESLIVAMRLPISREAAHMLADGIASSASALAQALSELDASLAPGSPLGREAPARGDVGSRHARSTDGDPTIVVHDDAPSIDARAVQSLLNQSAPAAAPTPRAVAMQVAKYFRLTLADLKSPARRQALVLARGVAFVLIREMTDKSLEQIGAYFGGRDHSTVLHSCRRTEKLAQRDATVRAAMTDLKRRLTSD